MNSDLLERVGTDTNRFLRISTLFATAAALAALTGCGGGGSSATSAPPVATPSPAPAPAPSEPPPVLSVPTPTYAAGSERLAAYNRVNALRTMAGLGLVAQNAQLDQAAQAHAQYNARYGGLHTEVPGNIGFTGADPGARITAAGYPWADYAENVDARQSFFGVDLVNELNCIPYHRLGIMSYALVDLGVGYASDTSTVPNNFIVLDFARPTSGKGSTGQGATAPFFVWPLDSSTGTQAREYQGESPNPVPELMGAPWGCAVSVHTNKNWRSLSVSSFVLYDATGAVVPTKLLTYATDVNLQNYNDKATAFLIPLAPLAFNSTYTATFTGGYRLLTDPVSVADTPLKKTWSFTTGPK